METVKITRRSIVGYAINTGVVNTSTGQWMIPEPNHPMWTGTIKSIRVKLADDRYLNSLGNTYKSSAWFVKNNGSWSKINIQDVDDLELKDCDNNYIYNSVIIDIRDLKT